MSDTPSGDIVSKNPKTTLLITFTAILETAIQHIKNEDYRQIAVPIAPFGLCFQKYDGIKTAAIDSEFVNCEIKQRGRMPSLPEC